MLQSVYRPDGRLEAATETTLRFLFMVDRFDENQKFITPEAIVCEKRTGEILIADTEPGKVYIFDENGQPLYVIQYKEMVNPCGLAIRSTGEIYVSDRIANKIFVFDFQGGFIRELDLRKVLRKRRVVPGRIAFDRFDNLYVLDKANYQFHIFDEDLKPILSFGSFGERSGEFEFPLGVAVGADFLVYVSDGSGIPLQVFDWRGRVVKTLGQKNAAGKFGLSFHAGICYENERETLWVADSRQQVIKGFDKKGNVVGTFGGFGDEEGKFLYPTDLAVDSKGRIFVVEKGTNRFQAFKIVRTKD